MYRFWDAMTRPILDLLEPSVVLEVGSDHGFQTRLLLDHARTLGYVTHVVDPLPKYDVDEWQREYGERLVMHRELSLNAIPLIDHVDVALIDGDHNWYTVINELRLLDRNAKTARSAFPVTLLHDVGWPYGRRDLYYDPETIPDAHRHPHRRAGIVPGQPGLVDEGGLNPHLENAIHENTLHNGVRTAVEDHIEESSRDLVFHVMPGINGFGILLERTWLNENRALAELLRNLELTEDLHGFVRAVERDRIRIQIEGSDRRRHLERRIAALEDSRLHLEQALAREEERRARSDERASQLEERLEEVGQALTTAQASLAEEKRAHEQTVRELDETRNRAGQQVAALREEIAELRGALQRRDEEIRDVREELDQTRAAIAKEQRRYKRLIGRRAVRVALAVASLFRPMFRVVRRIRKAMRSVPDHDPGGAAASDGAGVERPDVAPPADARNVQVPTSRVTEDVVRSLGRRPHVTVVIPVFNAPNELARCLDSVARNTTYPADLLLIDDASTDPGIPGVLAGWEDRPCVTVLRNEQNLGFTRTVNRGFEAAPGDVVILNSDTQVPPRWLENLMMAAYSSATVGSATAVSNNAGAFSVPDVGQATPLPAGWNVDDLGRLFLHGAERTWPDTPTANGFCAYIKRALLDDVGGFDAEAFPRGYGEENDLSMRALRAGWDHVVDDASFVLHERQASFGESKSELSARGRERLEERYPEYTDLVRTFVRSEAMESVRTRSAALLAAATAEAARPRPRILFVVHEGTGGTPAIVRDHVRAIADDWEPFVLLSNTKHLKFGRYVEGALEIIHQYDLEEPLRFTDESDAQYREFVTFLFGAYGFELVHVRHLIKHTFDVPDIARALNIPVVLSFHDHYLVCPTVHLLDEQDRFCSGVCTPGQGKCRIPMDWIAEDAPHLKHGWVYTWRERVRRMLESVDIAVTTSPSVRDVHVSTFERLAEVPFPVVPHGRDLEQFPSLAKKPSTNEPTRILVIGNLDVHKGAKTLERVLELDVDGDIEFHFLGRVKDEFSHLGEVHGRFQRERLAELVAEIAPSFIAILSITAESYNHVLTEAWSFGVPVIGSNMGAVGERIRARGGGWTVDPRDASAVLELIRRLRNDPEEYENVRASATVEGLSDLSDMAVEYSEIYWNAIDGRRALGNQDDPLRVDLLVHGESGQHPGSVHVRTLSRLRHSDIRPAVRAYLSSASSIIHEGARSAPDIVLVQRDALDPGALPGTLEAVKRRESRLIVDLDDDLLSGLTPPGSDVDVAAAAEGVRMLCREADLVTVSTPHLGDLAAEEASRVELVPNHLDERLWFAPLDADPAPRRSDRSLCLLYMGSWTHAHDLRLLEPVLGELTSSGVPVELSVIGGGDDQPWFDRIDVPAGCSDYRRFVPWLRSMAPAFDVGVAPLLDTPFNRAKSDLKFLEYTAMGLPTVASRVTAYEDTIDEGITGLLASSPDEWVASLQRLQDRGESSRILRTASSYVRNERTIGVHLSRYGDLLRSLVTQ